jgi:hypothetical protein
MAKRVAIILARLSHHLVMKPVSGLRRQLSKVIPVRSAEAVAGVEQVAAVGQIQSERLAASMP